MGGAAVEAGEVGGVVVEHGEGGLLPAHAAHHALVPAPGLVNHQAPGTTQVVFSVDIDVHYIDMHNIRRIHQRMVWLSKILKKKKRQAVKILEEKRPNVLQLYRQMVKCTSN